MTDFLDVGDIIETPYGTMKIVDIERELETGWIETRMVHRTRQ